MVYVCILKSVSQQSGAKLGNTISCHCHARNLSHRQYHHPFVIIETNCAPLTATLRPNTLWLAMNSWPLALAHFHRRQTHMQNRFHMFLLLSSYSFIGSQQNHQHRHSCIHCDGCKTQQPSPTSVIMAPLPLSLPYFLPPALMITT